jgi:repressor LexA
MGRQMILAFGNHMCYSKGMSPRKPIKLTSNEIEALKLIRSWFLKHGRGTSIRELTREMDFGSTRTAVLLINRLIEKGILLRKEDGGLRILNDPAETKINARTVEVPLVGRVACGAPIYAKENIEAYFPVSVSLAKGASRYFLLRAEGQSMNKMIQDGDLVLVRQQVTAENGEKVVALIDDEATIKEIEFTPDAVILKPRSTKKGYRPILLDRDFQIQGVVVATLPAAAIEH